MQSLTRLRYLLRIAQVYSLRSQGPLSFWHETPRVNENALRNGSWEYFMAFQQKADYGGPFDSVGVPILDYRGDIGKQYNPIAIAQYGLAHYNRWCRTDDTDSRVRWMCSSNWLADNLSLNPLGQMVWLHHFNWPYRTTLIAPWQSGLAQGCGISLLVRAAISTGETRFVRACAAAFAALSEPIDAGGTVCVDEAGHTWIEEYLVDPPSHILNGFIWAMWGVYDWARFAEESRAVELWNACVRTLEENVDRFDCGWWSLYEVPHLGNRMLASAYYHQLHIAQLRVMYSLTGIRKFEEVADRFTAYSLRSRSRLRAGVEKAFFKLTNY